MLQERKDSKINITHKIVHITLSAFGIKLKMNPQKSIPPTQNYKQVLGYPLSILDLILISSHFDGMLIVFNLKGHKNNKKDNNEWLSNLVFNKNPL